MKRSRRPLAPLVEAAVGHAAGEDGRGIAYARIGSGPDEFLLRLRFGVAERSALRQREAGYAAVTAVVRALRARGARRVRLRVDDAALVADLSGHRDVPPPIVLPYVRLRCALNQLDDVDLQLAADADLVHRARAEAVLNVAA